MTTPKAELADRIAAKQVVVVVGTGVSVATTGGEKLASWKELISNGLEECGALGLRDADWVIVHKKLLEGGIDDLLGVAEQVSRCLGWKPTPPCEGPWSAWLRKTVGKLRARQPELIQAIRDLSAPIATLNYDNLLTEVTHRRPITWQRAERWLPVLQSRDEAILHLHGHWDEPSSVVLGIRSYDAVIGKDLPQHLQRVLATMYSLLFIGCSGTLEDPNFTALTAWMREQLRGVEHSHYLLVREREPLPVERSLLREAGIVPLRYGKEHADLLPFIRDLAPGGVPRETPTPLEQQTEARQRTEAGEPPRSTTQEAQAIYPQGVILDHGSAEEQKQEALQRREQVEARHAAGTMKTMDDMGGGTIFISYRRGQDAAAAGRMYDRLEHSFGPQRLFMDVDNIPPGEDFVAVLEAQVAACDVLLALIGRGWLTATDNTGRRLENPNDFVRIEIASALAQGKRVIPVLVDDAVMPRANELPEDLMPLTRRQAVRITHDRFRDDVERLARALEKALAQAKRQVEEEERLRAEEETKRKAEAKRRAETPEDDAEAVKWYRKAADQGDALAQADLGFMYKLGRGVPQDDAEAVKWYRKAADQGYAWGQADLGFMYENGRGIPQDSAEAVKWFRKAADQGYAWAQANLGFMYENGRGVPQDSAEAVKWYRKAADQGDARGQADLGVMYENGRGVPQDDAEAVKWFRKAASQGDAKAQDNLSRLSGKKRRWFA